MNCAVGDGRPFIRYAAPVFSARVVDRDGGQDPILTARFYWGAVGSGDMGSVSVRVPNGGIAQASQPAGTFIHGGKYTFSAEAADNHESSDRSGPCEFEVDTVQPDRPPRVSSTDFPADDESHGGGDITGAFTFKANNVADVKGFYYGYENPSRDYVAADQLGGEATVDITVRPGFNTLNVQSVDRAGNVNAGQPERYQFIADFPRPAVARWRLDGNGDDVVDNVHPLTASPNGVTWIDGLFSEATQLDPEQQGTLSTADLGLRTDQSFSVAAWVKVDQKGDRVTAVSQDGERRSGFALQYSPALDRWVFNLPGADADGAAESSVASIYPVETDVWTRLTGVYDAEAKELRFYVDGGQQGVARHETPWNASGPFVVGRGKVEGNADGYWGGGVDDVEVYDRALTPSEIR
ncbi:LamG domain-containing protein [Lentzea kentuckyensis]|uniref:LamG domain-containing protein n=1 Tax=Lentzea kentuckyensis TaxID=360086 RepID=UPI00117B6CDA|nr:LamG domain-containing protein [Lentzea kentuckyensis]